MIDPRSAPSTATAGLARSTVQGVFWIGGGQAVRQVIRAVSSVVLARLLLPADFGLMGMAAVFFSAAGMLTEFGIGSAVVQSDNPDEITLSSAFWTNTALSMVVAVLLTAFSPAIAQFYGEPNVAPVLSALSLSLVIGASMVVPRAILNRRLDFRRIARAEVVGSVIGSVTAIALAAAGFGVWALVSQPLVGTGASMAMVWFGSGWVPSRVYSWAAVAPLVGFSVWVLGSFFLHFASRNVDQLLIGRVWGKEQLGFYALAFQLMTVPVSQVAAVVAKVLYPALAHVKKDPARIRGGFLRAVTAIGMVTYPMFLGLFAVSNDLVPVAFGERWMPMRPVLDVFCFSGILITVGAQVRSIYMSLGRTRTQFLCELVTVPPAVLAYLAMVGFGIRGVAFAFLVGHLVTFAVNHSVGFRLVGLTWHTYLTALSKPLLAAAAMAGVLLVGARPALEALGAGPVARLSISVPLGVALYVLFSWIVNREMLLDTIGTVRGAASRRQGSVAPASDPGEL